MPMQNIGEKEKEPAKRQDNKKPAERRPQQQQRQDDRQQNDANDSHQGADAAADEAAAYRAGRDARSKGMSRKAILPEFKKDEALTAAWLEGFDAEGN